MWMEAELIKKGLQEQVYIEVESTRKSAEDVANEQAKLVAKQSVKKMVEAQAKMIQWVEMFQLVHLHKQDPMVIWEKLAVIHKVQELATGLVKQRKFLMASIEPGEMIMAWMSCVKEMAFGLEQGGLM